MPFKVVDLFCGGGGISEGFRQAGFEITLGLDYSRAAIETFNKNHNSSSGVCVDLSDYDITTLPKCDVLVGGPPCVGFSTSNRAGGGNVFDGLKLVQVFLRAVHHLKPRYWIMENVPRITKFIPERIPLKWIGLNEEGEMEIPFRGVFNSANFGVPQLRKRFLMGKFPLPDQTHTNHDEISLINQPKGLPPWKTLGEALASLPNLHKKQEGQEVEDFNYGYLLPSDNLTDHFYDPGIPKREWDKIRRAKILHPFYGHLQFPDRLDRPARTVVATQLGRETLVIKAKNKNGREFRRATIRECAVLQTFPITYQFFGNSHSTRYRLVGDAVPPRLSFSIAVAILRDSNYSIPNQPKVETKVLEPSPAIKGLLNRKRKKRNFKPDRKFREFIPGREIRGCRVDLDNLGDEMPAISFLKNGRKHESNWVARFYVGEGKDLESTAVDLKDSTAELLSGIPNLTTPETLISFFEDLEACIAGNLPDATTLQSAWIEETNSVNGPYWLTDLLSELVDRHFPKEQTHGVKVPPANHLPISPKTGTRIRILAGLVAGSYAAIEINDGWRWAVRNPQNVWPPVNSDEITPGPQMQNDKIIDLRLKQLKAIQLEG